MIVIDTECYIDYWLLSAKHLHTGKVRHFELFDCQALDAKTIAAMMRSQTSISFNGFNYDLPLIVAALSGWDNKALKRLSDKIIKSGFPAWKICRDEHLQIPSTWDHIDLIEVAPGQSGLKIYGGRMNAPKMQDLPIEPDDNITPAMREPMRSYCVNDLDTTEQLYRKLEKAIDLRAEMSEQYGMDLRSKSDAQIAETVIKSELCKNYGFEFKGRHVVKNEEDFLPDELAAASLAKSYTASGFSYSEAHFKAAEDFGICASRLGYVRSQLKTRRKSSIEKKALLEQKTCFRYLDPKVISFKSTDLQQVFKRILSERFTLGPNGSVMMPRWLRENKITIGSAQYQMGIGGLHSCESGQFIRCAEGEVLSDWDVASYYPNIILQQRLAPESLGAPFLRVYQSIVERRMAAKKAGDKVTADTLKIAVNGSFGKLGSKYSALYAPDLLIQTTITGQLALLMLIERMEAAGVKVISANTDGIVVHHKADQQADVDAITWEWMLDTSYTLERTDYRAIASRDVNNYVAVKLDGSTKGKGCFAGGGLQKNPDQPIIYEAVAEYIAKGAPIAKTITECDDICKFCTVRRVKGGAVWRGEKLGKAVRFYLSESAASDECIHYATNSNRVPKSAGAKPLMELPAQFPDDVDYHAYLVAAEKLLCEVGYKNA